MKRVIVGLLCATLAACAAQTPPAESPTSTLQPTIPRGPTPPRLESRVATRNFLQVVNAVEPVAEAECRARTPRSNCDFKIVVDERPNVPANAYQTIDSTGRPILAFTVPLIADARNQDELAFVMAHEAAHHIRGHLDRQQTNATIGAVLAGGLAGALGRSDAAAIEAAQQYGAALGARTYSKDFELEADELGTIIAARAGFNPLRGAEFFFRIPDPGSRFLGSHPPNSQRVAVVTRTAARLGFQ